MSQAASDHSREQALQLLMRYSGLALRDGDTLTLRRAKTQGLERIARPERAHCFWTGASRPQTVTKCWRARLKEIAGKVLVAGFKPHRLRDTSAVELLLRGVAIWDESTLLGHSSIRTTERYYAPRNWSRRERLATIVRDANEGDELLRELAGRSLQTGAGAALNSPRNRPGVATQSDPTAERIWMA